ncbi:jg22218, partial [Pararge aegeria aegeria]
DTQSLTNYLQIFRVYCSSFNKASRPFSSVKLREWARSRLLRALSSRTCIAQLGTAMRRDAGAVGGHTPPPRSTPATRLSARQLQLAGNTRSAPLAVGFQSVRVRHIHCAPSWWYPLGFANEIKRLTLAKSISFYSMPSYTDRLSCSSKSDYALETPS